MSRAFVREVEGGEAFEELPDRPINPHSNLVTAAGLAQIDAEIDRVRARLAEAKNLENRAETSRSSRDLRYWMHRRASAEVAPDPINHLHVRFGSTVTFKREDGREQSYRIVGEDEADPSAGTISYVSPLAQTLMGKEVGILLLWVTGKLKFSPSNDGEKKRNLTLPSFCLTKAYICQTRCRDPSTHHSHGADLCRI